MNGVECVAFERPDGKTALIVINDGSARRIKIDGDFSAVEAVFTDETSDWGTAQYAFDGYVDVTASSVTTFLLS